MNHAIDKTVWPAATLNNGVKDLITKFYQLADSKQPDAGARMASEVFSKNAILLSPNGTFQGSSGILCFRANFLSTHSQLSLNQKLQRVEIMRGQ